MELLFFWLFISERLRAVGNSAGGGVVDYSQEGQQAEHSAADSGKLLGKRGVVPIEAKQRRHLAAQKEQGGDSSEPEGFVFQSDSPVNFHDYPSPLGFHRCGGGQTW